MNIQDYLYLPKERLAELLVEAEERYNALLATLTSSRKGSPVNEHISAVRSAAAKKRWQKPMQNDANAMQIASCKSDSESDNKDANAYANAMQNECKNTGNAKPIQNMQFALCKSDSESTTNDANAMQIAHAKTMQNDAKSMDCEEKEERKKDIKKKEEKEILSLKEKKIYIKKENSPYAQTDEEKEKSCAKKEKEETGVVGNLFGESDTLPQQPEKMQETEEKAAKTGYYFDFRKRLIAMVREDAHSANYESVVDDWMRVRRNKRASNTQTAFKRVKSQIEKARRSLNMTAEECVRMSAEHSWQGFECEWARNFIGTDRTGRNNKQIAPAVDFRDID